MKSYVGNSNTGEFSLVVNSLDEIVLFFLFFIITLPLELKTHVVLFDTQTHKHSLFTHP